MLGLSEMVIIVHHRINTNEYKSSKLSHSVRVFDHHFTLFYLKMQKYTENALLSSHVTPVF